MGHLYRHRMLDSRPSSYLLRRSPSKAHQTVRRLPEACDHNAQRELLNISVHSPVHAADIPVRRPHCLRVPSLQLLVAAGPEL